MLLGGIHSKSQATYFVEPTVSIPVSTVKGDGAVLVVTQQETQTRLRQLQCKAPGRGGRQSSSSGPKLRSKSQKSPPGWDLTIPCCLPLP